VDFSVDPAQDHTKATVIVVSITHIWTTWAIVIVITTGQVTIVLPTLDHVIQDVTNTEDVVDPILMIVLIVRPTHQEILQENVYVIPAGLDTNVQYILDHATLTVMAVMAHQQTSVKPVPSTPISTTLMSVFVITTGVELTAAHIQASVILSAMDVTDHMAQTVNSVASTHTGTQAEYVTVMMAGVEMTVTCGWVLVIICA
jgi:hypothetical protein